MKKVRFFCVRLKSGLVGTLIGQYYHQKKKINLKKLQERGIFMEKPDICIPPAKDGDKREYNEKLKNNCGWLLIRKRQNRMKKAMRHTVHLSKGTGAFCLHTSSGIGVPLIRMLSECRLFCCPETGEK